MYWWCEFSLCWGSLHLLLQEWSYSLLWRLCHLIFIAKKSDCWLQTSAYSVFHWGSWPLQLHIQCIAAVRIMLISSLISGRGKINYFTLWSQLHYLHGDYLQQVEQYVPREVISYSMSCVFWFVRIWQWRFPLMLQFASKMMPDLTATCISQFGGTAIPNHNM